MVEDQAVDSRIPQQRLDPGKSDGIVGAQQLLHPAAVDKAVMGLGTGQLLTGFPVLLCSLAFGHVKPIGQPPGECAE